MLKNSFIIALILTFLACAGGSGGGGSTSTTYIVTYDAPANSAAGNIVIIYNEALSASTGNTIFDVLVYGTRTDVYSVSFHLCFEPSVFRFARAIAEDSTEYVLTCSPSCTALAADGSSVPGKLIVGLTRTNGVGVNLGSGAHLLLRIYFTPVGKGTFDFDFECGPHELENSGGTDIATGWFGGTVTVN